MTRALGQAHCGVRPTPEPEDAQVVRTTAHDNTSEVQPLGGAFCADRGGVDGMSRGEGVFLLIQCVFAEKASGFLRFLERRMR